jgi:hypothetical protein
MTITDAITDTCRCGHPWHEDACTDRRTVADIRGGTKREDCKCPSPHRSRGDRALPLLRHPPPVCHDAHTITRTQHVEPVHMTTTPTNDNEPGLRT